MWKSFAGVISDDGQEGLLLKKLSAKKLPSHVAIIMDGNGRWAEMRNLQRAAGHKKGGERAQEIIESSARLGIPFLTLFTFSTENWNRPVSEVRFLFKMLSDSLTTKKMVLEKNKIRFNILGDIEGVPSPLKKKLFSIMESTRGNDHMHLNLAFNYGSRLEIVQAVKKILKKKINPNKINVATFSRYLYTQDMPDPDLVIRTSGEMRISNFLLYQAAYSEFYFTSVLWPDFGLREYLKALMEFQNRKRRYGNI